MLVYTLRPPCHNGVQKVEGLLTQNSADVVSVAATWGQTLHLFCPPWSADCIIPMATVVLQYTLSMVNGGCAHVPLARAESHDLLLPAGEAESLVLIPGT